MITMIMTPVWLDNIGWIISLLLGSIQTAFRSRRRVSSALIMNDFPFSELLNLQPDYWARAYNIISSSELNPNEDAIRQTTFEKSPFLKNTFG